MKAKNRKEKYEKIKEKKLDTTIESLCKGYPSEFTTYLKYCRNLKFEEKPDYDYINTIFKDLIKKMNIEIDHNFDWTPILKKKEMEEEALKKEKEKNGEKITEEIVFFFLILYCFNFFFNFY